MISSRRLLCLAFVPIIGLAAAFAQPEAARPITATPNPISVGTVPKLKLMTCILSQAPKAPGTVDVPAFPDGKMVVIPQQFYEPTMGDDVRLDRFLRDWGCTVDGSGYVFLDLEYRFGVVGNRAVQPTDYTDIRTDETFKADVISAIKRVKVARPTWKVGIYFSWLHRGLGQARTTAELESQRASRLEQHRLNNRAADVFASLDFSCHPLYRRNETVGGEPMNYDIRDSEALLEIKGCRDRANPKCELWVMVSPLQGAFQTGTGPIRVEAVTGPMNTAANIGGFAGVVWWGNCANEAEYDHFRRAIDRVSFGLTRAVRPGLIPAPVLPITPTPPSAP